MPDNTLVERLRSAETFCGPLSDVNHLFTEAADALEASEQRVRELEEAGRRAIETLAASRHLIAKYVPDHHWLPEHDKRIAELKATLTTKETDGLGEGTR